MKFFEQAKNFLVKNRIWLTAVVSFVLAAAFIGSVLGTLFSGGEFRTKYEYAEAKGMITVNNVCYSQSYLKGDRFLFDKKKAEVRLLVKDPAIEDIINIAKLPASEYGFLVNGEGDYIDDPSTITMDETVKKITLVSRAYPNLTTDLSVEVIDGYIDEAKLTNELLIEAEDTDLYSAGGTLLTAEEKASLPDASKPYLSNVSTSEANIKGENCSGGACIRNFANGMRFEFRFVSNEETEVNLEIHVCKRPNSAHLFDGGYVTKLNGEEIKTNATVPAGPAGDYFDPYSFTVTVTLQRGLNVLTFEMGQSSPGNLDAIRITPVVGEGQTEAANILGLADAIVVNVYDKADKEGDHE